MVAEEVHRAGLIEDLSQLRIQVVRGAGWGTIVFEGYCLIATSNLLAPVRLSVTIVLIVLRSTGSNIMRLTRIDFPSHLSVSLKVPLLNRFTETLLNPGSPFEHEPNLNRGTVRTQS